VGVSKLYDTDLSDAAWSIVESQLPAPLPGGRPRTTNLRAVVNAVFYLLRTGCQWRLLPHEYPPRSSVYHYFSMWRAQGMWTRLQWELHKRARISAGRAERPTVVIMDGEDNSNLILLLSRQEPLGILALLVDLPVPLGRRRAEEFDTTGGKSLNQSAARSSASSSICG
jgi:transposase